jgi:sialate O-acetylesterase
VSGTLLANVRLPSVFSDHAVLQQGVPVPVWGWADPGEDVAVTVAGKTYSAKAGADGAWRVALDALKPGQTLTLTVKGKNTLTVQDVLVGEVWLGSGQSNMAMTVNRCKDFDKEQAAATLPQIRMFTVDRVVGTTPQKECKGQWVVCAPETVGAFSATAYFFGRDCIRSCPCGGADQFVVGRHAGRGVDQRRRARRCPDAQARHRRVAPAHRQALGRSPGDGRP